MNIRHIFLFALTLYFLPLHAEKIGNWKSFLASSNTTSVVEADNRVYGLAYGTLYSYNKEDQSIQFFSRQTGLSDMDVKLIGYNQITKTLVIVYSNGNVDLLSDKGIYNLPFLKNASHIPNREPTNIYFHNDMAYLTSNYGVHEIHLGRKEFLDTYHFKAETYAVCIKGETIYAATINGLKKANIQDNLVDNQNWQIVPLNSPDFKTKNIRVMALFENQLCFFADSSGIFYLDTEEKPHEIRKNTELIGMKLEAGRLMAFTHSTLYIYNSLNSFETVYVEVINDVSSLKENGGIWLASGEKGLTGIKRKEANQYEPFVANLNLDGPKRNLAGNMVFHGNKLLIVGGGWGIHRPLLPGTLMVLEKEKWTSLDDQKVNQQVGYECLDYTSVAVDPTDDNHYFVSTFGEGILEIKNNELVKLYNHSNSSLQAVNIPGLDQKHYVRIGSVCFDKKGYLWGTNIGANNGIVVRKPDGTWTSLAYNGIRNVAVADKILITSKGHKWVNIPHNDNRSKGMLVFDDKGTPENNADDVSNFFETFRSGTSNPVKGNIFYCMAEDHNGEIWIGTNQGPIICSNPGRAIDNPTNLTCNQIIRTEPTAHIFLEGEIINAIAVDGGNRKWIGTAGSGLYLVSPDGQETILHFDMNNSPLYSNTIQSLAINHQTGEVYIGTDKGILSYQSEAIEPASSYSDVYAFPNPVRPEFDGQVVITGLMQDSNVKITDLSGNLIYQGKSAGGQMMWNCKNHSGQTVSTGVYLVLASTSGGKESVVAKIAVVQ